MTCEHISRVLDRINNLIKKSNDKDSSLFKMLKSIVDKENISTHLDGGFWSGYSARTSYSSYDFYYISRTALYEELSDMFDELKRCNCRNDMVKEFNNLSGNSTDKYNKLVNEYNELLKKHNENVKDYNELLRDNKTLKDKSCELLDKYNDLNNDYEDIKEKYENTRTELQSEKIRRANEISNERLESNQKQNKLLIENAKLQEKLESKSSLLIEFKRELESAKDELSLVRVEKENQVALIENKLDQKQQLLETVRQSLADLRVEHEKEKAEKDIEINQKTNQLVEKENELKRKDEEIKKLRSQKGFSREELLTEKLRSGKENLKLFVTELKVGLEQIQNLSKYHERLFVARKTHNQVNVDIHEENIARSEEELRQTGISVVNIQEIGRKCERIAELRWELEQSQQQYQARQEVPINN